MRLLADPLFLAVLIVALATVAPMLAMLAPHLRKGLRGALSRKPGRPPGYRSARRAFLSLPLLAVALVATGCDNFEVTTYKVLATDQAIIEGARDAYIARTIPRTAATKSAIETAGDAHNFAVQALLDYHNIAATKGAPADQTAAAKAAVQGALVPLAKLVGDLEALGAKPATGTSATTPNTALPADFLVLPLGPVHVPFLLARV